MMTYSSETIVASGIGFTARSGQRLNPRQVNAVRSKSSIAECLLGLHWMREGGQMASASSAF